jgi:hypothetical protein
MHCWSAALAARSSSTFGQRNEEFRSSEHGCDRHVRYRNEISEQMTGAGTPLLIDARRAERAKIPGLPIQSSHATV